MKSKKRAYIVRFVSCVSLCDLLVNMNMPGVKTPAVKINKDVKHRTWDFRTFQHSEFHALKEVMKYKVNPSDIESIFQFNS